MTRSGGWCRRRSVGRAAVVCLALLPLAASLARADEPLLERRVKAAFLYKFASYVMWPPASLPADAPIRFAVIGDDSLATELAQTVADRTVEGHRPIVVTAPEAEVPSDAHILFVGHGAEGKLRAIAHALEHRPVLIVSDAEGGLARGSMINFVISGGHVRFEIALTAAERSGLGLSSRLLAVAQSVVRAP